MARRFFWAALVVAALAAASPVQASTHSAISESLTGTTMGTNGYRIQVFGYHHHVTVVASLEPSSTSYIALGAVTDNHLTADFDQFGSLDLTFERHGKARHPHVHGVPPGCHADLTVRPGVLRGAMTFHARNDVTVVEATEIPAKSTVSRFGCTDEPEPQIIGGHGTHGHPAVFLNAGNSRGRYGTSFSVMRIGDRPTANFSADVAELIDRVRVYSSIYAEGPANAFTYNVRQEHAVVEPPAPFSGSATLARGPGGATTWTGDLTVDIPGYGVAPLTGSGFQAQLGKASVIFYGPELRPLFTQP
jgi:hypothetical protein